MRKNFGFIYRTYFHEFTYHRKVVQIATNFKASLEETMFIIVTSFYVSICRVGQCGFWVTNFKMILYFVVKMLCDFIVGWITFLVRVKSWRRNNQFLLLSCEGGKSCEILLSIESLPTKVSRTCIPCIIQRQNCTNGINHSIERMWE